MSEEEEPLSPFWSHLCIGNTYQIVDQDRVRGTVKLYDIYPDGRRYLLELQIISAEFKKA